MPIINGVSVPVPLEVMVNDLFKHGILTEDIQNDMEISGLPAASKIDWIEGRYVGSFVEGPEDLRCIAGHEAGHVVVASLVGCLPVAAAAITNIRPMGRGKTWHRDVNICKLPIIDHLKVIYAGVCAEEILGEIVQDVPFDQSSDGAQIEKILRAHFDPSSYDGLRAVARSEATDILRSNFAALNEITAALTKTGFMSGKKIKVIMDSYNQEVAQSSQLPV